ncbi:MAG: HAD-IA family hydrolase [Caldimicrobium sp.]
MFKVIFLDAEGTFLKFNPSLGRIYSNLWSEYDIKIDEESVAQKMRKLHKEIFQARLGGINLNGEICKEAWRKVFEETFSSLREHPNFNDVFEKAYAFFSSPECVKVVSEFYHFLRDVKALNIKLAIISNWDSRLYSVLKGHNLISQFEAIFLGCEVGYLKPHLEIFKRALSYFKVKPKEALMIGDSWEDDIEPAQKLGIPFFHVKEIFPSFEEIKRTYFKFSGH